MNEKGNANVIVVQDNEQKKVHRLTWEKYINGICRHKWWVIGATVLTGVLCFGAVKGVNSIREKLSVSYSYKLPTTIAEDKTERFVNGEVFDYSVVVTKKAFEDVKASNKDFANINVDKLYEDGAISVERNINTDYENEITYTLSARMKEFSSIEVGRKFMVELINYPLTKSSNAINNYSVASYIDDDFENGSYLKKVNALKKQFNAISTNYSQIKARYGAYVAVDANGKTLTQAIGDFESKSSEISTLLDSMFSNGYVDYEEGKEAERVDEIKAEAQANIVAFQTKMEQKNTKLSLLQSMEQATIVSTLTNESEYVREMISLKNEIEVLSNEIKTVELNLNWAGYFYNKTDGTIKFDTTNKTNACYRLENITDPEQASWKIANNEYKNKLTNSAEKLNAEVVNATNAFHYAYNLNNTITIWGSGYVDRVHSIPWVVGLVVGLLLGFAVSSLITAEIPSKKDKKIEE